MSRTLCAPSAFIREKVHRGLADRMEKFGSWSKHPETGPKLVGLDFCRFVHRFVPVCGHRLGHFCLASSGLGADLGPKSTIPGRILKRCRGPCSSAEQWVGLCIVGHVGKAPGPRLGGRRDVVGLRPISKSNDFLGQSEDIWGTRGPHFRPILVVPGVRPA